MWNLEKYYEIYWDLFRIYSGFIQDLFRIYLGFIQNWDLLRFTGNVLLMKTGINVILIKDLKWDIYPIYEFSKMSCLWKLVKMSHLWTLVKMSYYWKMVEMSHSRILRNRIFFKTWSGTFVQFMNSSKKSCLWSLGQMSNIGTMS